jgi:signal-transduction protein with cAMP-binding, CBS, and nucleotidyltransferase domain
MQAIGTNRNFCFESLPDEEHSFHLMALAGTVSAILADKGPAVWSTAPNSTVFEAIKLMAEKNVGALAVMENDKLVGIISERDYTRKVVLQGRLSKETFVGEIMTKDPFTAHPGDSVSECMELMTDKHIRHLPVTESGTLVGLVSLGDLVRRIILTQSAAIHHLEQYITGAHPV